MSRTTKDLVSLDDVEDFNSSPTWASEGGGRLALASPGFWNLIVCWQKNIFLLNRISPLLSSPAKNFLPTPWNFLPTPKKFFAHTLKKSSIAPPWKNPVLPPVGNNPPDVRAFRKSSLVVRSLQFCQIHEPRNKALFACQFIADIIDVLKRVGSDADILNNGLKSALFRGNKLRQGSYVVKSRRSRAHRRPTPGKEIAKIRFERKDVLCSVTWWKDACHLVCAKMVCALSMVSGYCFSTFSRNHAIQ